ncbi:MAG: hypothetical protein NTW19_16485 [Planctomycetota bacterium]|nr:hypothetical protein [Planctomycetota bacterium]
MTKSKAASKASSKKTPTKKAGDSTRLRPSQAAAIWAQVDRALAAAKSVDLSWIDPPPAPDGWTLTLDALRFVTAIVDELRPRHIVEMGAGLSTRVIATAGAKLRPPCAISSIDHDPEFGPGPSVNLAKKTACKVAFQFAPLVVRDCGGKLLPQYHFKHAKLASSRPADLAVVDGPPINLGGREGTIYQILGLARPGTLILLDDADRTSERSAVAHWQDTLGDAIEARQLPGFVKGMAAVLVIEPVQCDKLWDYKAELSRRELDRLIPRRERFVLIDQQWLVGQIAPGRGAIPFLERDGVFHGAPESDADAIAELERQRKLGTKYAVFTWPLFWWLDYYAGFHRHLRETSRVLLENDRLVVFELKA